jgi:hypothetical protein
MDYYETLNRFKNPLRLTSYALTGLY